MVRRPWWVETPIDSPLEHGTLNLTAIQIDESFFELSVCTYEIGAIVRPDTFYLAPPTYESS